MMGTQKHLFCVCLLVISTEMYDNNTTFILHVCLLGLLLTDVFFHTVVQDRADAKGLIPLDQWLNGYVVLASNKLAIKCHLHELVEGSLAHDLLT